MMMDPEQGGAAGHEGRREPGSGGYPVHGGPDPGTSRYMVECEWIESRDLQVKLLSGRLTAIDGPGALTPGRAYERAAARGTAQEV